jgi:hypothetical protein
MKEDWGKSGKLQVRLAGISRFQAACLQTAAIRIFRRPINEPKES